MIINNRQYFKKSAIYVALSGALSVSTHTIAQEESAEGIERIAVTASRRASSVQETPVNITALDGDVMKDQNISQLSDVARWVPGLSVPDQGGRSGSTIIVRGLNTNSSGPDSDGGTVATYVGEIPLFVDMKLIDVERVEVLIGPQGTLYGAGTLGGAIRYLPNKPVLDETSGSFYGDIFNLAQSNDTGGEAGVVFNTPLIDDEFGIRFAYNYLDRPGYVDYGYLVREGGVSLPDPDWTNPSDVQNNLKKQKDVNSEETSTARLMLRWTPTDYLDATLSYFYQKQEIGGRSIVHYDSLSDSNPLSEHIGRYESGYRYVEPREKEDSLISLEITADLGFAELTSATGFSEFEATGQRDQTDLLIRLDYSYEEFPAFSSFTREEDHSEVFTQEIRLVSTSDSELSWIVGGYYNNFKTTEDSREFTPGFDQFAVDNWGGNQLRPDDLEYISIVDSEITEQAIFGEISYQATDQLSLTLGGRYYEYEVASSSAIDLPLYYTLFGDYSASEVNLDFKDIGAEDDGNLLKFNVSYQFSDDVLTYLTISEGFRIGGSNGVAECPDNVDELNNQIVCALPHEATYQADTTTNYELGFKSSWFKNKLHFNSALFFVEWDNAQVGGATENGQQPITSNAATAEASGIEISTRAMLSDNLTGFATYAYTKAELTADASYLFGVFDEQGSQLQNFYDGASGDRLPGSPEQQVSLGLKYSTELFNKALDINYGMTYQSDVYTKLGLKADGEKLPGYALSNLSAQLSEDNWSVTFYVDNLFDKYAFSSARRDRGDIGLARFSEMNSNDPALQRNYGHYLITPRKIGVRFEYMFDL
ncbi:TonB-dependent receptor [Thalassotalea loyana]|jgi:outer membrane receptor protein involved in Fe transport|uniref:TonB-dependent receptor n=1 Tax=Thalassotalea loyana TaxID=280483 RepID=A0ABQ6HDB5_9GAMM|nr:TonB-dependent receptor [Thalassotalea loyana]GLX86097.1 TonB-dependent receptor [Thalassotalea loyana]